MEMDLKFILLTLIGGIYSVDPLGGSPTRHLPCPRNLVPPFYGNVTYYARGRKAFFSCDEEFELIAIGPETIRCRGGRWEEHEVDCFWKKRCPELIPPENGDFVENSGRNAGDRVGFACRAGYELLGTDRRTCMDNFRWDGIQPTCESRRTVEDVAIALKNKFIDPMVASTSTNSDSRLSVGKTGLELFIAIDRSNSIGILDLNRSKEFMKSIVEVFGISPDHFGGVQGTRVALFTFGAACEMIFNLNDEHVRNVTEVFRLMDTVQPFGGSTNLEACLSKIHVQYVTLTNSTRATETERKRAKHVTKALFILTDGNPNVGNNHELRADSLKKSGFEIFFIGIGKHIDKEELKAMASEPKVEHVFMIDQFSELQKMVDIITEKNMDYDICGISGNTELPDGTGESRKGAWPWLGWLSVGNGTSHSQTCGGALVCNRWFITAAQCVYTKDELVPPEQVELYLADRDPYEVENTEQALHAINISIHPSYNRSEVLEYEKSEEWKTSYFNPFDVALIDLGETNDTWPELNKYVKPICILSSVNETAFQTSAKRQLLNRKYDRTETTAGWIAGSGFTPHLEHSLRQPWKLKQTRRRIQNDARCRRLFENFDGDRFFCVGNYKEESSTCEGDIGGPYMNLMDRHYLTLGLALDTKDCAMPFQFSVFLNLLHEDIVEWLDGQLQGCNRKPDPRPYPFQR